jgi:hypothetical protein
VMVPAAVFLYMSYAAIGFYQPFYHRFPRIGSLLLLLPILRV